LQKRFLSEPKSNGYDERAAFEKAAHLMIQDHSMGVGANEYVLVANTQGYSNRAGVIPAPGSRSANVHNVYLLIAAETGMLGLASFVVLLVYSIFSAFRLAWAKPRFRYSQLALAVGVTLAAIGAHNFVEWIFVTEGMQYLFAICLGSIIGLRRQRMDGLAAAKRNQRLDGQVVAHEASLVPQLAGD
jgi:O-antigen ligase